MDNAEEIMHFLEVFTKRKTKSIPPELNDYLSYVARTGDPVFQWGLVKSLFKEKLLSVLSDFYENSPGIDIPHYPNVDLFNYDSMKNSLLERLDTFQSAPFTLQRICELLINPRKEYNRIDKFMRAIETNILVVSTREPGPQCIEQDNGDPAEPMHNGSDNNSDYNVDVEMEEVSWKEARLKRFKEQPGSSYHKKCDEDDTDDDSKSPVSGTESQEDNVTEYESVTPPDDSANDDNDIQESDSTEEDKADDSSNSSDEVMPKPPDTDSKYEERKSFVIPKIVIHLDMSDQKESIAEVNESNSDADKPKEDIAKKEATLVSNNDVKTQVTAVETDDVPPYERKVNGENIKDVSPEEDISQDKMNHKSPKVNTNVDKAIEKCEVQDESVSEPPVKTTDNNSDSDVAERVLQEEPDEPNATECTVRDIESPKSPSIAYSPADSPTYSPTYSPTEVESTDSAIEADTKDEPDLAKSDQDLTEPVKDVPEDKHTVPLNDKTLADADQIPDKPAESSVLAPDSST